MVHAPFIPDLTRPMSKAYDFFQPNIAIEVGKPPTTFHINSSILCTSSAYFRAALSNKDASTRQSRIELSQNEPAAFNVYLNWLHRGKLFINHQDVKGKGGEVASRESFWFNILECYFLGDKLQDSDFKDALVDAALLSMLGDDDGITWFPGRRIRQQLYARTAPGCCMRSLFVHIAASLTNVKELVDDNDPLAFRQELQQELANGNEEDTYEVGAACAFHEHAPGKGKCHRAKRT